MKNKIIGLVGCVVLLLTAIILGCLIEFQPVLSNDMSKDVIVPYTEDYSKWTDYEINEKDFLLRDLVLSHIARTITGDTPEIIYTVDEDNYVSLMRNSIENALEDRYQYIVCLSPEEEGYKQEIVPFSRYRLFIHNDRVLSLVQPEDLTENEIRAIKDELSAFEKTLYSYDSFNLNYGYKNFIDVKSFVDCYLLTEIACPKSLTDETFYLYKNNAGKYGLVMEDYSDVNFDINSQNFIATDLIWMSMLLRIDSFTDSVIREYRTLRRTTFSDSSVSSFISDAKKQIQEYNPEYCVSDEEADALQSFIMKRLAFMDENIESLRQLSARSAIKNYTDEPY